MTSIPVEERLAINELVNLYALFCDTHQFDKVANLFAEDCLFDERDSGGTYCTTRDAIRASFQRAREKIGPMFHICANHVIAFYSGAEASGACHVLAEGHFNIEGEQKPFRLFGYFDDRYVKQDNRWLFKSRVLRNLVPGQGATSTSGPISYDLTAPYFSLR